MSYGCDLIRYFCSTTLELEVGGGRKISNFSTVRMLYSIGIQVIAAIQAENEFIISPLMPMHLYLLLLFGEMPVIQEAGMNYACGCLDVLGNFQIYHATDASSS